MMLRSLGETVGYTIQGLDGEIGSLHDVYFDDDAWTVRYMVVDTGILFSGRRVLIGPVVVQQPRWENRLLPVRLTIDQIRNSPSMDARLPVSRRKELELHRYYGWNPYWMAAEPRGPGVPPPPVDASDSGSDATPNGTDDAGPSLRSMKEMLGYRLRTATGPVGRVDDFIVEDTSWGLRYLVIRIRRWLKVKRVLVATEWLTTVSWRKQRIHVEIAGKEIKNSPEYDPGAPVNLEYEKVLYDYHGRPLNRE